VTDRQAILDEIIEFTAPPRLEADEFTITQYLERLKEGGRPMLYNTAQRYLGQEVDRGVLTKRKVLHGGRWHTAYRITSRGEGGG